MNKNKIKNILLDHTIEILLVLVIVIMAVATPTFLTPANILNIFRNQAMKGVIAFGMTLVIISGQIDLSVGSQVALSGVIIARICRDLPAATGISVDAAFGSLNVTVAPLTLPASASFISSTGLTFVAISVASS